MSVPESLPRPLAGRHPVPTFCLTVRSVADPGSLPRLLEVFAKRGLVPSKLFSVATGADELTVDLQVAGLDAELGAVIANQLRAQVGIETVLTSVKTEAV
jgi:acetolactate synthase small subunit